MQRVSDEKNESIWEYGIGGLLELVWKQPNMPLCIQLLNKINVAYCHIEMDGDTNIEMTCTHVGQVFGIPHKGRKLFLGSHTNHDAKVPPINEIENQMCDCEVPEEFR